MSLDFFYFFFICFRWYRLICLHFVLVCFWFVLCAVFRRLVPLLVCFLVYCHCCLWLCFIWCYLFLADCIWCCSNFMFLFIYWGSCCCGQVSSCPFTMLGGFSLSIAVDIGWFSWCCCVCFILYFWCLFCVFGGWLFLGLMISCICFIYCFLRYFLLYFWKKYLVLPLMLRVGVKKITCAIFLCFKTISF